MYFQGLNLNFLFFVHYWTHFKSNDCLIEVVDCLHLAFLINAICLNYLITRSGIFIFSLSTHCYKIRAKWNTIVTQLQTWWLILLNWNAVWQASIPCTLRNIHSFAGIPQSELGGLRAFVYNVWKSGLHENQAYFNFIWSINMELNCCESLPISFCWKELLFALPGWVTENCFLDAPFFIVLTAFYFLNILLIT